jgi:hypothetical protein
MTTKQQLATGFLALMIVGSVALMPASAETRVSPSASGAVTEATVVAQRTSPELAQDQVRDLTYN